jgi:hypothetical protein
MQSFGPLSVYWRDDSHRAVIIEFNAGWTWFDFDNALKTLLDMMREFPHPVDIVADVHGTPHPPDANILPHLQRAWQYRPANLRHAIYVNPIHYLAVASQAFAGVTGGKFSLKIVKTMQEADEFLASLSPE